MAERMGPTRFGVAPREHLVRGIEEEHLGMRALALQRRRYLGPLREEDPLARVDSERNSGEILATFRASLSTVGASATGRLSTQ